MFKGSYKGLGVCFCVCDLYASLSHCILTVDLSKGNKLKFDGCILGVPGKISGVLKKTNNSSRG